MRGLPGCGQVYLEFPHSHVGWLKSVVQAVSVVVTQQIGRADTRKDMHASRAMGVCDRNVHLAQCVFAFAPWPKMGSVMTAVGLCRLTRPVHLGLLQPCLWCSGTKIIMRHDQIAQVQSGSCESSRRPITVVAECSDRRYPTLRHV